MIMKTSLKITLPAIVAVFAMLVVFMPAPKASALSAADWRPGRIIDDAVFFNKDAMNVQQIQNFLNAKVPVCDRNHPAYSASIAPPFTCLKEYNENTTTRENNIGRFNANGTPYQVPGGKSSAQIIWEASQAYGINPQSLIVMLQKETGIVTDTWAAKWQYDRAMGYACPDSGPNNSANCDTSFYGFYNQVNSAAKQLKNYVNSPQYFNFKVGVTRNIQWHPNAACGSSPVYIETQATAALYNYTPYQPNATALSNLYGGQTNGCSSYGNRNFWVYFNDWFGSTTNMKAGVIASYKSSNSRQLCNINILPGYVGRLYQPDTKDYLLTNNILEACVASSYGYIWDGAVFEDAVGRPGATLPIYRLSGNGKHIYTSSPDIKNQYITNYGYSFEGIMFYGYPNIEASQNLVPVYHMGNETSNLLTSNDGEKLLGEAFLGLNTYGVAFFTNSMNREYPLQDIYRVASWQRGRLYTKSDQEKSIAILQYGFRDELSSFKSSGASTNGASPVYRLRSPEGKFFFTNSRPERDLAVINFGYLSEGIGFYGRVHPSSQSQPVYRLSNYQNGDRLYTTSTIERDQAASKYGYTTEGIAWYDNN